MRKCQKFLLKLVVKSAFLAAILKNQLFLCQRFPYFPNRSAVLCHCACNLLSQNTTAHITTVAMDDVICLGRRNRRAFMLLVRTFVNCYQRILLNASLSEQN